eukprot:6204214-Pleurochrysis_carterae.AAC.1
MAENGGVRAKENTLKASTLVAHGRERAVAQTSDLRRRMGVDMGTACLSAQQFDLVFVRRAREKVEDDEFA